jgi:hypothetical protein
MKANNIKRFNSTLAAVAITLAIGAGVAHAELIDNKNGTIYDTTQRLVWMKKGNCFDDQSWGDAMSNIRVLKSSFCGLNDGSMSGQWRLPTKEELLWRGSHAQGFGGIYGYYWTSTPSGVNYNYYTVYIGHAVYSDVLPKSARIWAVRNPVVTDLPRH